MTNVDLSPQSIWAALGILCFIIEMVAPAFVMLFVGFGALVVASVLIFYPELGLVVQILLFASSTGISFLLLRPMLLRRFKGQQEKSAYSEYIGELATVVRAGNGQGSARGLVRVQFRGTEWDARPAREDLPLVAGQTVKIVRMDGTVAIVDLL